MRRAWIAALAVTVAGTAFAAPAPKKGKAKTKPKPSREALLDPSGARVNATAPAAFRVNFATTRGDFVVKVTRAWAPLGADRFYNLVKNGFFDGCRFFRVVPGFVVQFGINGDPKIAKAWRDARIQDDPVKTSNRRGTITFATSGPNSRTTQLFINFGNNGGLDGMGFSPFGEVESGMDVVDAINAEYGEKPDQGRIQSEGNAYFEAEFPRLDYIKTARLAK